MNENVKRSQSSDKNNAASESGRFFGTEAMMRWVGHVACMLAAYRSG
jgi:hypothetical protein